MMSAPTKYRLHDKGFTIIEVIMTFGILAIITFVLAKVFNTASLSYKMANNATEVDQSARTVLDQISREIRNANPYYKDMGAAGYSNTDSFSPLLYKASNPSGWCGGTSIGDELFFVAPWRVNDTQASDVIELGYYLDRGASPTYEGDNVLRRCAVADNMGGYNYETAWNWGNGNTYTELAFGVREFTLHWYGQYNSTAMGGVMAWQAAKAFVPSNAIVPVFDQNPDWYLAHKMPRAIRIRIRVIAIDDALKYRGNAAKLDQATRLFTTVVYLSNAPDFN
jgi:type II secretory pathway pseudopilin PulG